MLKTLFLALAFWPCLFCAAQLSTAANDLIAFIQQKGDSLQKAEKLPGVFVGVFNGKRNFFSFGYAVPDEKLPFDSSTVFEAGSITKTFTAYVLESVLAEKGIADSVSILPYLPDSVRSNKALASITFLSLLNHTSGLPRLPGNMQPADPQQPYADYGVDKLFGYLKTVLPQPDGKSNYSNLGAGLAGVLAQRISGKDYETLLRTYVFRPFDMENAATKKGRRAQGHFNGQKQAFWSMNALAPAGGLQCSASDMLNYLQAMSLSGGRSHQRAVIEKLLQPTVAVSPTVNVCRAWHTLEQKGRSTIYWHNGGTYGFSTFAAFIKSTERAVIVVVNAFNKNNVSDGLGMAIMKRLASQ